MADYSANAPHPELDDERIPDWLQHSEARGTTNSSNARKKEPERTTNPYEIQPAYNPMYRPTDVILPESTNPIANTRTNCPGKRPTKGYKCYGICFFLTIVIVVFVIYQYATRPVHIIRHH